MALSLLSASAKFGTCTYGTVSGPQDNVMRAYIAHFGGPADNDAPPPILRSNRCHDST
jgi:hypothetical protein